MGILSWVILGLIAGFIGSKIVNKTGEGLFLDIALGVTLLHGCCEARVGAGERSITRHGRRWPARDRAYD